MKTSDKIELALMTLVGALVVGIFVSLACMPILVLCSTTYEKVVVVPNKDYEPPEGWDVCDMTPSGDGYAVLLNRTVLWGE